MAVEPYEPITQAIKTAIAAFSLLLLALSISAYRKTAFKKILYAAVAFGLFAIQMFLTTWKMLSKRSIHHTQT